MKKTSVRVGADQLRQINQGIGKLCPEDRKNRENSGMNFP